MPEFTYLGPSDVVVVAAVAGSPRVQRGGTFTCTEREAQGLRGQPRRFKETKRAATKRAATKKAAARSTTNTTTSEE